MYYNQYRYFSPESGMYISQDPIGLKGDKSNFYHYTRDNNTYIDPFGLIEGGQFGTFSGTANRGNQVGNGIQRHHLNQSRAFPNFDRNSTQVIGLGGNATTRGTQHYNAHIVLDDFFDNYRGTPRRPSAFRYNVELFKSLRNAGMGVGTSIRGVFIASIEQMRNGIRPWSRVPNIPRRTAHH